MIDCYENCKDIRNGACPPMKTFCPKKLAEHDKQIRNGAIEECLVLVDKIMPPQPYLLKSKHYENWKMKTTELRMLRDMLEQLKEKTNEITMYRLYRT